MNSVALAGWTLSLAAVVLAAEPRTAPATFYVDSIQGRDDADGTAPASAWRTLQRVNEAALIPGDRVLFRRGCVWRGSLRLRSGNPGMPVTFGAYGEGEKPILQRSVARDAPEDWEPHGPGVWATRKPTYSLQALLADLRQSQWSCHTEGGAQVALEQAGDAAQVRWRLACSASGSAPNHIQLWGPALPETLPPVILVRLRMRCTVPFRPARLHILRNGPPWTGYRASMPDPVEIGEAWETHDIVLRGTQQGELPRLNLHLGGRLPAGAVLEVEPAGAWEASPDQADELWVDVGNIIFDHGRACGVKKWRLEDLQTPGDYVYHAPTRQVFLRAEANPATLYRSIELALRDFVVSMGNTHDVIVENLAVRYGAAHGFGGDNTARLVIRHCDVYFIGGGHQFTTPEGHPVRFGNGIEFWCAAEDNLVEGCRLWEVYDAALTNQGSGPGSRQKRITYRNNVIWNCEYSFEYWNRPAEAVTEDILFENNTCVDAGCGWAHRQRPDPNGGHLMFYGNAAKTSRFVVRNNVFCRSTEVCLRMDNNWCDALTLEHNLWHQDEGKPVVRYLVKRYFTAPELPGFREETGLDAGSAAGDPHFVDPVSRDYRLAPGSPGLTLAHDGGPVGARPGP